MSINLPIDGQLKHGGNLPEAIKHHGKSNKKSKEEWLDMSTGISPWSWPIPDIDPELWRILPNGQEQLIDIASQRYQSSVEQTAVTPGSQLAIRMVPQLFKPTTVAIPSLGYQEHAHSWALAGHSLVYYDTIPQLLSLAKEAPFEHAVVINPNNPSGDVAEQTQLTQLASALNGYLFVDEAFIDCLQGSHSSFGLAQNIVVYKSLGKFFGLAGLRVGFVLAEKALIDQLNDLFQPWPIAGPSQFIATQALLDKGWQDFQSKRITAQADLFTPLLQGLMHRFSINRASHSGLFHTLFGDKACIDQLHQKLADAAIWTRTYNDNDKQHWLRLSLPANIEQFKARTLALKP